MLSSAAVAPSRQEPRSPVGRGDGFTLGANGLPTATNPYPNGKKQHAFRMPTTCQLSGAPNQEWLASHNAYDKGRMDGFVRTRVGPTSSQIVKWNLPALTYRDANANDLTDFLDLKALAAKKPTYPKLPPLAKPGNTKAALACSTSGAGTIPPPGSISG